MDTYRSRTARSLELHEEAKEYLPGGDTRTINHFWPHPVFMAGGDGCVLTDVDGNDYLDFSNNMSATIHGHGHPALVAAARRQVRLGTALGTPVEVQVRHAAAVRARVPSIQRLRYCNSGTEATMMAIRAARAFTGRDVIAKIDGGYHGLHDTVEVNMFTGMDEPRYRQDGLPATFPFAQPARGVPARTINDVRVFPYNDLAAATQLLDTEGGRIAAVIVEPMMGAAGGIIGQIEFLRGLRELTRERGVLLIFDECATFRLGPLQIRYDIAPDLTTLSKVIGGGLPLGAFGGRADVMARFDPTQPNSVYHAGAMAGNNLSLEVGLAALETYDEKETSRLNELGDRLIRQIPEIAFSAGVKLTATGIGSFGHFHWGEGEIRDPHDAMVRRTGLAALPELFHLEMLNHGIYFSRRGLFCLSMPMSNEHVDRFLTALGETLATLRPYVERELPQLSQNGN